MHISTLVLLRTRNRRETGLRFYLYACGKQMPNTDDGTYYTEQLTMWYRILPKQKKIISRIKTKRAQRVVSSHLARRPRLLILTHSAHAKDHSRVYTENMLDQLL